MARVAFVIFAEQHAFQHLSYENVYLHYISNESLLSNTSYPSQETQVPSFIADETSDSFMATIPNTESLTLLIHIH